MNPSSLNLTTVEKSAASAMAGWKRPQDVMANGSMPSVPEQVPQNSTTQVSGDVNNEPMQPRAKIAKTSHAPTGSNDNRCQPTYHFSNNLMAPAPTSSVPTAYPMTMPASAFASNPGMMAAYAMGANLSTVSANVAVDRSRVADDENIPRELKPAPYFYYRDFSQSPDDDPLTPLTPLARVPNFPAKMHAILSRPDLADVVTWMPHGRSWRVLKPREFEIRVIPTYFEHSKFSSFIRQANGWGFRRITRGKDRNSYYHELFLRGLPHLCKRMKRPGVSKKPTVDVEHEPDFYQISQEHPVPEKADTDDNILLPSTLIGGPKARMPVRGGIGPGRGSGPLGNADPGCRPPAPGHFVPPNTMNGSKSVNTQAPPYFPSVPMSQTQNRTNPQRMDGKMPHDPFVKVDPGGHPSAASSQAQIQVQQYLQNGTAGNVVGSGSGSQQHLFPFPQNHAHSSSISQQKQQQQPHHQPSQPQVLQPPPRTNHELRQQHHQLQQHQHQHQNHHFQQQQQQQQQQHTALTSNQAAAFQQALTAAAASAMSSDPTSQFAAGFAAATALTNPHFQLAFNQAIAEGKISEVMKNPSLFFQAHLNSSVDNNQSTNNAADNQNSQRPAGLNG